MEIKKPVTIFPYLFAFINAGIKIAYMHKPDSPLSSDLQLRLKISGIKNNNNEITDKQMAAITHLLLNKIVCLKYSQLSYNPLFTESPTKLRLWRFY
jgi:hypothetical protein